MTSVLVVGSMCRQSFDLYKFDAGLHLWSILFVRNPFYFVMFEHGFVLVNPLFLDPYKDVD